MTRGVSSIHPVHEWLAYREAANYVGLTERQLRRAVAAGKVTHARPGLAVLFRTQWLDEFLERATVVAK